MNKQLRINNSLVHILALKKVNLMQTATLAVFLMFCCISTTFAQTNNTNSSGPQLDAASEKVKKQIMKIGQGKDITVKTKNGRMLYGSITNIESDLVLINDIDQKQLVEIKYSEITKVLKGYSNDRDLNGNRIPIKKRHIGLIIAAAAIIIPVVIVLSSLSNEQ